MELNIKNNKIEICQLQIDNKALTKSKLFSLPISSYLDSLERIIKGELQIIARFPYELYAESIKARDKLLATTSDHPPFDLISKYVGYDLVGVLLYDPALNALSKTWFTANEYITEEMSRINKASEVFIGAQNGLSELNEYSDSGIIGLFERFNDAHVRLLDGHFAEYVDICRTAKNQITYSEMGKLDFQLPRRRRTRNKSEDDNVMTEKESQKWFDDKDSFNVLGFDEFLNPTWLSNFLCYPFEHDSWVSTKKWISFNINQQLIDLKKQQNKCNKAYDSVMVEFKATPIILI